MKLKCLSILVIGIAYLVYKIMRTDEMEPVVTSYPALPQLVDELKINERLSHATRMAEGEITGPESFAFYEESIFTGLANGSIVKITDNKIELFCELRKCPTDSVEICSRTLGLSYNEKLGKIIAVDAYNGIFAVDPNTAETTKIFPFEDDPDFKVTFFNSAVMLPDGRFVVTESSTKFKLENFLADLLEGRPNGRLLLINPKMKEWSVLVSGLYFPNGLELEPDGKAVLVAETAMSRILRISLDSAVVEEFSATLPGMPDNIKASENGGYWVALVVHRFEGSPSVLDALANWPKIRLMVYRIFGQKLLLQMGQMKKHTIVVRIDEKGHVKESLHDTTGRILGVSEAADYNGVLYLGNFNQNYYGKVSL